MCAGSEVIFGKAPDRAAVQNWSRSRTSSIPSRSRGRLMKAAAARVDCAQDHIDSSRFMIRRLELVIEREILLRYDLQRTVRAPYINIERRRCFP